MSNTHRQYSFQNYLHELLRLLVIKIQHIMTMLINGFYVIHFLNIKQSISNMHLLSQLPQ